MLFNCVTSTTVGRQTAKDSCGYPLVTSLQPRPLIGVTTSTDLGVARISHLLEDSHLNPQLFQFPLWMFHAPTQMAQLRLSFGQSLRVDATLATFPNIALNKVGGGLQSPMAIWGLLGLCHTI